MLKHTPDPITVPLTPDIHSPRHSCFHQRHSPMFESLRVKYELHYITKETLRGRVKLYATKPAKGITAEEYEEITGEKYEEE